MGIFYRKVTVDNYIFFPMANFIRCPKQFSDWKSIIKLRHDPTQERR